MIDDQPMHGHGSDDDRIVQRRWSSRDRPNSLERTATFPDRSVSREVWRIRTLAGTSSSFSLSID